MKEIYVNLFDGEPRDDSERIFIYEDDDGATIAIRTEIYYIYPDDSEYKTGWGLPHGRHWPSVPKKKMGQLIMALFDIGLTAEVLFQLIKSLDKRFKKQS